MLKSIAGAICNVGEMAPAVQGDVTAGKIGVGAPPLRRKCPSEGWRLRRGDEYGTHRVISGLFLVTKVIGRP
jgi:hypothetical protein